MVRVFKTTYETQSKDGAEARRNQCVATIGAVSRTDDTNLGTAERQALSAEWQRLEKEPAPPDRRTIGCATVVVAIGLAAAGPPLARLAGFDLAQSMKIGATVVLALAFLAGILMAFLGSGRFARDSQRAEEALQWLATHGAEADPEERRAHAVSLLLHAYCTDGPSTTTTLDFEAARHRLGDALPYVMAAERVLRVDRKIYPVFTDSKVRLPG